MLAVLVVQRAISVAAPALLQDMDYVPAHEGCHCAVKGSVARSLKVRGTARSLLILSGIDD